MGLLHAIPGSRSAFNRLSPLARRPVNAFHAFINTVHSFMNVFRHSTNAFISSTNVFHGFAYQFCTP